MKCLSQPKADANLFRLLACAAGGNRAAQLHSGRGSCGSGGATEMQISDDEMADSADEGTAGADGEDDEDNVRVSLLRYSYITLLCSFFLYSPPLPLVVFYSV